MTDEEQEVLDVLTDNVYVIVKRPRPDIKGDRVRLVSGRLGRDASKKRILQLKKSNPNAQYYIAHYKDLSYSLLTDIQTGLLEAFHVL